MNVVLYSANYGGYDLPHVQPDLGIEQVMFTDDPDLCAPGWEIRHRPLQTFQSSMLRAKWWKCRPDLAVPDADVSLWIDSSMTITAADYVSAVLDQLGTAEALFVTHPWRDCIYEELTASECAPKYNVAAMRRQVAGYRSAGHPEHWGLFAANSLNRRRTAGTTALGMAWFQQCVSGSWQDQLSLPVLVRRSEIDWRATDPVVTPWQSWWEIAPHLR